MVSENRAAASGVYNSLATTTPMGIAHHGSFSSGTSSSREPRYRPEPEASQPPSRPCVLTPHSASAPRENCSRQPRSCRCDSRTAGSAPCRSSRRRAACAWRRRGAGPRKIFAFGFAGQAVRSVIAWLDPAIRPFRKTLAKMMDAQEFDCWREFKAANHEDDRKSCSF